MELKLALCYKEQIKKLRIDHNLSISNDTFLQKRFKKSELLAIRLWI